MTILAPYRALLAARLFLFCLHRAPCKASSVTWRVYRFDGSTVLVIKTDMTYTVTHQTTHILSPGGPQNALDKSHTKPPARQAARRTGVLDRCRRAKDKPGGQPRRVAPLPERRLAPERRSQPCSERVGQTPLIRLKKERKRTTQGRDGRTARRHHTGILRRGVWC